MKEFIVKAVATGLGTGYAPIIPGTFGSMPAWILAYFIAEGKPTLMIIATVVLFILSVWSASEAESLFGHDARKIVIDEWVGMFITLLFVPYSLTNYLIAFLVFRALDVFKIFPARSSESLPGGWGVTMDDVVAGIQSNIVTQLIVLFINR